MNIFSKIKEKIFGPDKDVPAEKAEAPPAEEVAPSTDEAISVVDVEARLDAMPRAEDLNWRSSIVDLMKLIGLDASFTERKHLAIELGRSEYSGSAEDNVWLHWAVMKALAEHGGKVPPEFRD